jgi:VWFA-related protein
MRIIICLTRFVFIAACLSLLCIPAPGQEPSKIPKDDVIRIDTDLVQTAVTVTDNKGQFVQGLKLNDFDLRIDGKPQPILFLERVVAGSAAEELLAAGNAGVPKGTSKTGSRGRTIVFFIDDLHLSLQSLDRARQTLTHFIDTEMTNQDMAAIVSASGQIGFLQQFTNNKEVLRAALNRLNHRPYSVRGYAIGSAQMTEYVAYIIDSRSDPKITDVYTEECMKQNVMPPRTLPQLRAMVRATCETQVKNSARAILLQASAITLDTYNSLESLMRSSARMPGRKLAFFISDGFLLDAGPRGPDLVSKLQQIIDAAQRSGVVVYTIDAKGLVSTASDATNNRVLDPNGRLESALMREIAVTQDALHALAGDTGGRALRNQNGFERFVSKILDETSNYYLIGWRPDTEEQKTNKFRRVEVTISGRPEITVRLPRGYIEGAKAAAQQTSAISTTGKNPAVATEKTPGVELRDALGDAHTKNSLPTLLSVSYLNTPSNGMVITSSMQIAGRLLDYGVDRKQRASVDLAGMILNDKGKVVTSFKQRLSIDPLTLDAAATDSSGVIYNHRAPVPPGIYQVRVAARDERSSRVGSAMDWIVVPDLVSHHLTTSSLLVGGQVLEKASSTTGAPPADPQVQFSVDRRFSRSSTLGFWVFIYNAMRDTKGKPNLTVQVQVLRDGQTLVATPQRKLSTDGMSDLARIPYGGDVALKSLSAGRYELRVIITDLLATAATTLSTDFHVE